MAQIGNSIYFGNLNKVPFFDREPIPDPKEIYAKISSSKYFTELDLCNGYWQISMKPAHRDITSFVTPDGLYRFKVMSFSLINLPASFNRMMRKIQEGLEHTDIFLTDDILIHTEEFSSSVCEQEVVGS